MALICLGPYISRWVPLTHHNTRLFRCGDMARIISAHRDRGSNEGDGGLHSVRKGAVRPVLAQGPDGLQFPVLEV